VDLDSIPHYGNLKKKVKMKQVLDDQYHPSQAIVFCIVTAVYLKFGPNPSLSLLMI
jgi:hypothetical protein